MYCTVMYRTKFKTQYMQYMWDIENIVHSLHVGHRKYSTFTTCWTQKTQYIHCMWDIEKLQGLQAPRDILDLI